MFLLPDLKKKKKEKLLKYINESVNSFKGITGKYSRNRTSTYKQPNCDLQDSYNIYMPVLKMEYFLQKVLHLESRGEHRPSTPPTHTLQGTALTAEALGGDF